MENQTVLCKQMILWKWYLVMDIVNMPKKLQSCISSYDRASK